MLEREAREEGFKNTALTTRDAVQPSVDASPFCREKNSPMQMHFTGVKREQRVTLRSSQRGETDIIAVCVSLAWLLHQ